MHAAACASACVCARPAPAPAPAHHSLTAPRCAVAGDTIVAGVEALSDALELGAFDDKTPAALTISREYMGRMTTAERLTM